MRLVYNVKISRSSDTTYLLLRLILWWCVSPSPSSPSRADTAPSHGEIASGFVISCLPLVPRFIQSLRGRSPATGASFQAGDYYEDRLASKMYIMKSGRGAPGEAAALEDDCFPLDERRFHHNSPDSTHSLDSTAKTLDLEKADSKVEKAPGPQKLDGPAQSIPQGV